MDLMREIFGEPIATYTRAMATEDGVLVDVSEAAKRIGFSVPVAFTASFVEWLAGGNEEIPPAVLTEALVLIFAHTASYRDRSRFGMYLAMPWGRMRLLVDIGPGDQAEPVLTIGQPGDF